MNNLYETSSYKPDEKLNPSTVDVIAKPPKKQFNIFIVLILVIIIALVLLSWNYLRLSNSTTSDLQKNLPTTQAPVELSTVTQTETPLINPTNLPSACLPKKGTLSASENIMVLIVPAYFSDVHSELVNQGKRNVIYSDSFGEINAYLDHVQKENFGKSILHLDFILSEPILVTDSPFLYEKNPEKIRSTIQEKLPDLVLQNYQIVIMRALTNISTSTSGYNFGNTIWVNLPWSSEAPTPESIPLIEQGDQLAIHIYRAIFTSLMMHEIMHSFGMTDNSFEKEGGRYNIFYRGEKYDGSQELVDLGLGADIRNVDSNTGIFQHIGPFVRNEIGWSDSNNNKVIDAQEFCK